MPTIKFKGCGDSIHLAKNSNLTELDNSSQQELMFGCRAAACGSCAINVLEGIENLNSKNAKENHLLDMLCMNGDTHRLACQCKIHGNITIESLS
ncbi:2Fe-2S iron-sulfur cluster-binding protein [Photobacterium sp. SP02]|uniref:2Fe-2S iron-sulfur cluster-binding protein n=1 Tax=Photobacterium sp. SP02 TaxID=3032280 RepID=UPI0031453F7E